jgi:hypothetical protein
MSDFCLGRPMLDRVLRQSELMDRVLQQLGVSPVVAARVDRGFGFYEARSRCIACSHERECREALQSASAAGPAPFCPNGDFLRTCVRKSN